MLDTLRARIEATNVIIGQLAQGDEVVAWVASVPELGAFLSALSRYEVDDMRRFRTAKQFVSHTGLVPSTYASGPRVVHGAITKRGNKWLPWAFIEATTPAICHSPFFRRYYERIKARAGTHDARTATARKLAELVWTVWTERRC